MRQDSDVVTVKAIWQSLIYGDIYIYRELIVLLRGQLETSQALWHGCIVLSEVTQVHIGHMVMREVEGKRCAGSLETECAVCVWFSLVKILQKKKIDKFAG